MNPLIYITFIAVSFIASLSVYFYERISVYLRLFPLFLLITLIVELIGLHYSNQGKPPIPLYNFFGVFEFLFYMYVLREIIQSKTVKKIILHTAWLYVLMVAVNFIFIQPITSFGSINYALSCLLITIICIYYFFELFQSSHSVNLVRQPAFWICAGLLFFYCCTFPVFGMLNFLKKAPDIIRKNFQFIILLLNVFLYSSFTIAFLCRIRARNSTS
ncbi:hypothetical protein Q4E93_24445 [Flavitalea sp. BT771]|uniref:hypothetical protein n=1 Tax=Flavitalea sp. BT771 TaxID=3063329 RepID=UPI0026E1F15B|nr:hypothetical protein [Flavitalea sp. BT771]MDO6433778.1 hypothetical protein [Flavitalea sp. BT771]MDV6222317.1 hypothetical protein [Flavitalea sp. BT771]